MVARGEVTNTNYADCVRRSRRYGHDTPLRDGGGGVCRLYGTDAMEAILCYTKEDIQATMIAMLQERTFKTR